MSANRREDASAARVRPRNWAWYSATLAPISLVGTFLLAQSRQPADYDSLRDTLSALAAHPATDRWIMTTGFVLLGACHVVTASGLVTAGRLARAVLATGGIATLVVAASPQPAAAHAPAAAVAFGALAVWTALQRRGARRVGVPLAVLNAALVLWFVLELRSGTYAGLSERVVAVSEALTPVVVLLARRTATAAEQPDRRDG